MLYSKIESKMTPSMISEVGGGVFKTELSLAKMKFSIKGWIHHYHKHPIMKKKTIYAPWNKFLYTTMFLLVPSLTIRQKHNGDIFLFIENQFFAR